MIDTKYKNAATIPAPEFLLLPILFALTEGTHNDLLRDYRRRINTALAHMNNEDGWWHLTRWGLAFLDENKRHPESVEAVVEWFTVNTGLGGRAGSRDASLSALQAEVAMWTTAEMQPYKKSTDLEVIIQALLDAARQEYHVDHHRRATNMASGASPAEVESTDPDIKDLVGMALPDQARIYLARKIAADPFVRSGAKVLQGDVTANLDAVSAGLDEMLRPKLGARLLTGIKEIDAGMVIGPEFTKYIGVLGYLGSGKSTFLKSLILSFVRQGANILLCPREESPEAAMSHLIWCHAFDSKIPNLPSLLDWACNQNIGIEEQTAKDAAIEAWKSLPGSIEVIKAESLAEILEHYETHRERKGYSVLAVDYVAHLKVQKQRGESEQDAHKRDFETLQALSINEKLVILTPLQSNRSGFEAAKALDGDEYGTFADCNAVEYYSSASQGMDCVIGCFYHGEIKKANGMIISCPKPPRSGKGFDPVDLFVDPVTRRVRQNTQAEINANVARSVAQSQAAQAAREKRANKKQNHNK